MAKDKQFTKGLYPNKITTKYGEMQKIGIHKAQFMEWLEAQTPNDKGYISIVIGESKKEGKQYGYLDTYVPPTKDTQPTPIGAFENNGNSSDNSGNLPF